MVAEPDAACQEKCFFIDELPPEYRALIYEYGWEIVGRIINNNYPALPPVEDLEFELMGWRWKRQMKWLETDYYIKKAPTIAPNNSAQPASKTTNAA